MNFYQPLCYNQPMLTADSKPTTADFTIHGSSQIHGVGWTGPSGGKGSCASLTSGGCSDPHETLVCFPRPQNVFKPDVTFFHFSTSFTSKHHSELHRGWVQMHVAFLVLRTSSRPNRAQLQPGLESGTRKLQNPTSAIVFLYILFFINNKLLKKENTKWILYSEF